MNSNVGKWDYIELDLKAQSDGNPFLDIHLEAEFSHSHRTVKVEGFYDGGDSYCIRFMPDMEGEWQYVTRSNLAALDGQRGSFLCIPASGDNHGPVRAVDRYHFAYADETPYHPVGTTCYVWNHQGDELEEQTLDTLKSAPFNKMRMCVFPKRFIFNNNEPPYYPFEGEVKQERDEALQNNHRAVSPPGSWDFDQFNYT